MRLLWAARMIGGASGGLPQPVQGVWLAVQLVPAVTLSSVLAARWSYVHAHGKSYGSTDKVSRVKSP